MINEIFIPYIEEGYKSKCSTLETLVHKRLNQHSDLIFDDYVENNREYLDNYCKEASIDPLTVSKDKAAKAKVGEDIITKDIKERQLDKGLIDAELKLLNIPTISITNGIENKCKWYRILGNPGDKKWITRNKNKLIQSGVLSNEVIQELNQASEFLINNFIADNILRPDKDTYWDLIEYPISEKAEIELLKPSGN